MKRNCRRSPSYLVRNPHSFCFRMGIPNDLQDLMCKKELRFSLQTGYVGAAKSKARYMAVHTHSLFQYLREAKARLMELTAEKRKELIDRYFHRLKRMLDEPPADSEYIPNLTDPDEFRSLLMTLDGVREDLVAERAAWDHRRVQEAADGLLAEDGLQGIDKTSRSYKLLCRGLLEAEIKGIDYQKSDLLYQDEAAQIQPLDTYQAPGGIVDAVKDAVREAVDQGQADEEDSITVAELNQAYFKENTDAGNWKKRTVTRYETFAKFLVEYLGENTSLSKINYKTMQKFKATLQTLPNNYAVKPKYDGMSLDEIAESGDTPTMSVPTINGYLGYAKAVFGFAVRHGYILTNYADGLRIKQRKKPDRDRDLFDSEDLKRIFDSKEYRQDKHKKLSEFWLPILGLYTGCRIEEMCQLHLDDIREENGIWYLNLTEGAPDQSLKTASSERVVPLHPFIVEGLNFGGLVNRLRTDGEERLFPELTIDSDGTYSHEASKSFGRFKRRSGITSKRKVFHSFRHTISDHLKQKLIDGRVVDELTGHALQGESFRRYGKSFVVKTLYQEAVLKLDYGIDLSHLKNSKFVVKDKT